MYSGVFRSTLPRSANRAQIDALTTLRAFDAAAIAVTTIGVPIEYPLTAEESLKVIINQGAYSGYVAGTAQWTISFQASLTFAGTYVEVATIPALVAAGLLSSGQERFLSSEQINKFVPNARFLRSVATLTGAAGALTYGAYLVPTD